MFGRLSKALSGIDRKLLIVSISMVTFSAIVAFILNNSEVVDNSAVVFGEVTSVSTESVSDVSKATSSSKSTEAAVTTLPLNRDTNTIITTTQIENSFTFPADINTVSFEQLLAINGVGEVTANRILDYRDQNGVIRNIDYLKDIYGIGESTIEMLKQYLYVSDADYEEIAADAVFTQDEPPENIQPSETTASSAEVTPSPKEMKIVNINTASAQEIADSLLLSIEMGEKIVELRTNIQYFSNDLELLYVDGFGEKMLLERRPYITLE